MNIDVKNQIREISKGVIIFDLVLVPILLLITNFNINIIIGLLFGSVIATLNFVLLSMDVVRIVNTSSSQKRNYPIRMMMILATLVISLKYDYVGMIGTFIGLMSTKIVIISKVLLIDKLRRKEE